LLEARNTSGYGPYGIARSGIFGSECPLIPNQRQGSQIT
jgi:hypothetical protein